VAYRNKQKKEGEEKKGRKEKRKRLENETT
jgi:hypothetical protein